MGAEEDGPGGAGQELASRSDVEAASAEALLELDKIVTGINDTLEEIRYAVEELAEEA